MGLKSGDGHSRQQQKNSDDGSSKKSNDENSKKPSNIIPEKKLSDRSFEKSSGRSLEKSSAESLKQKPRSLEKKLGGGSSKKTLSGKSLEKLSCESASGQRVVRRHSRQQQKNSDDGSSKKSNDESSKKLSNGIPEKKLSDRSFEKSSGRSLEKSSCGSFKQKSSTENPKQKPQHLEKKLGGGNSKKILSGRSLEKLSCESASGQRLEKPSSGSFEKSGGRILMKNPSGESPKNPSGESIQKKPSSKSPRKACCGSFEQKHGGTSKKPGDKNFEMSSGESFEKKSCGRSPPFIVPKGHKVFIPLETTAKCYIQKIGIPNPLNGHMFETFPRLNIHGRVILRNILKKLTQMYSLGFACGKLNPTDVKICGTEVKLICSKEKLTNQGYLNDVDGFHSIIKCLCDNDVPMDVKHLIDYMKLQNSWKDWWVFHPITWNDRQYASSYCFIREQLKSLRREDLKLVNCVLETVWSNVASRTNALSMTKDDNQHYWKKCIPNDNVNPIMNGVYQCMVEEATTSELNELNFGIGFILYARTLLVRYSKHFRKYLEEKKIDMMHIETTPSDIARWIWIMCPDFMSLFMEELYGATGDLMWMGLFVPLIFGYSKS